MGQQSRLEYHEAQVLTVEELDHYEHMFAKAEHDWLTMLAASEYEDFDPFHTVPIPQHKLHD